MSWVSVLHILGFLQTLPLIFSLVWAIKEKFVQEKSFEEINSFALSFNYLIFFVNAIPTSLRHVKTVYGLIQPIASRNRVKCFHYNCKTNVTSTLHKISFSKEFA